jgi:hypothetical protein
MQKRLITLFATATTLAAIFAPVAEAGYRWG